MTAKTNCTVGSYVNYIYIIELQKFNNITLFILLPCYREVKNRYKPYSFIIHTNNAKKISEPNYLRFTETDKNELSSEFE